MSAPARPATARWLGKRYLARIGPFRIPSYTAMLYLGCVGGTLAGVAVARTEHLSESRFALTTIALIAPALVGARLWFVLQHIDVFRVEPGRLWRRSEGGSALYGGLLVSVAVSVPVLRLADLPFWAFWDAASITMLVGLIVTRAGCLMHGCCAGRVTSGRLGLWLPNHRGEWERRLPTPLFEAAWGAIILSGAFVIRPSLASSGAMFAVIVATYAAGRLLLDPTREASRPERTVGVNVAVSAGLLLAAASFLVWGWRS